MEVQPSGLSPAVLELQRNTREAFTALINDSSQDELWRRVRFTYEERKQLPWLPESGNYPGWRLGGLGGALAQAYYEFNHPSEDWLVRENLARGMRRDVDALFRRQLVKALDDAVAYETNG